MMIFVLLLFAAYFWLSFCRWFMAITSDEVKGYCCLSWIRWFLVFCWYLRWCLFCGLCSSCVANRLESGCCSIWWCFRCFCRFPSRFGWNQKALTVWMVCCCRIRSFALPSLVSGFFGRLIELPRPALAWKFLAVLPVRDFTVVAATSLSAGIFFGARFCRPEQRP